VLGVLPTVLLVAQAVFSVHVETVAVPVTVTDRQGHHVSGLTRSDFHVLEDGRPRAITVFDHGDIPATLGVVVDRSQSMRPKRAALDGALEEILATMRPADRLFGVVFNESAALVPLGGGAFTSDPKRLLMAVTAVPAEGRTALYDGVAMALEHLERARSAKSAIVVISDGGDNISRDTYSDVLALARQSQAVIYAIGLLGTPPATEEENAGLLRRLCKDTGGVAYFPRTLHETTAAAREIASDIREQYILGFSPGPRTEGGAYRKIEVTVSAPGERRLRVRARAGYTLPAAAGGVS